MKIPWGTGGWCLESQRLHYEQGGSSQDYLSVQIISMKSLHAITLVMMIIESQDIQYLVANCARSTQRVPWQSLWETVRSPNKNSVSFQHIKEAYILPKGKCRDWGIMAYVYHSKIWNGITLKCYLFPL